MFRSKQVVPGDALWIRSSEDNEELREWSKCQVVELGIRFDRPHGIVVVFNEALSLSSVDIQPGVKTRVTEALLLPRYRGDRFAFSTRKRQSVIANMLVRTHPPGMRAIHLGDGWFVHYDNVEVVKYMSSNND